MACTQMCWYVQYTGVLWYVMDAGVIKRVLQLFGTFGKPVPNKIQEGKKHPKFGVIFDNFPLRSQSQIISK